MSEKFPSHEERPRPTKAVIAAAGFGTRFLPQTKSMPKEMLPILDKPIIQIVVEELVNAGLKDIIIVGSGNKRAIEDHFGEINQDLLGNLLAGGEKKKHLVSELSRVANLANFLYVRQKGPYGNATPLLSAAPIIGNEPFIYTFADDFFRATPSRTEQLIETHQKYGGSVYAAKRVNNDDEYDRYGIVAGESVNEDNMRVSHIVEKPGKDNAPSSLASVSSYLFDGPEILNRIKAASEHHDATKGEFTVQPIMQQMIDDGHSFYAREITGGKYYDTGDKLGYLETVFDFALEDAEYGPQLREYLKEKLKEPNDQFAT